MPFWAILILLGQHHGQHFRIYADYFAEAMYMILLYRGHDHFAEAMYMLQYA